MFRDLCNFRGINWWTLLGGLGFNFVITMLLSLAGSYFALNEGTAELYATLGPLLMMLAIFLFCGLSGFITGKIADDVPLKHAFISSLGAVVPLVASAVLGFNAMPLMMAVVAVAGNFNGGMLAIPKPKYRPPVDRD